MTRKELVFSLSDAFVASYATRTPPFGFNGLGELVYLRTYSRLKDDGTQEQWHETVRRVVEGTYTMQKRWITEHNLGWSERKAQRSAQEMYDRIWNMKFLPPGRGLWAMGSSLTMEKDLYAALNNCAFVSTANLAKDLAEPFTFLMDASMLGIGVGFDTKGAGQLVIQEPNATTTTFVIPDTREGWVKSVELLLLSYFVAGNDTVVFDYTQLRPAGAPIKGFGGVASGAEPLKQLHESIRKILDAAIGHPISTTNLVDIMNVEGKCVVAGNVRRTAEIAFGEPDSEEFLDLKNYEVNPHRSEYGWTSNNSIFAELGMDYGPSATRVALNGEPGYAWLENMRAYGRMADVPDHKDKRVAGANPCVPGYVPILTKTGWQPIEELVGATVEVWNGFEWSEVTPRVTGYDQELVDVELSNGVTLTCTPAHKFVISTDYRGDTVRLPAADLQPGMKLLKHQWPVLEAGAAVDSKEAYTQGFVSGDGMDDYRMLWVYETKYSCLNRLAVRASSREYTNVNGTGRVYATLTFEAAPKSFVPMSWDLQGRLHWLAGLLDADGTVCNEGQVQICSIDRTFLLNVQEMLTTMGVASKVRPASPARMRPLPDGKGGTAEYECQATYRLLINASQIQHLCSLGLVCDRLDLSHMPQRDASRFVYVERVVPAGHADVVYCFTEPKRNLGSFGGVVTGQCVEQSLESYELCCLVETFPANHDSLEDYKRTLKFAYLYGKTVTLGKTPWARTNRVLLRNRRIGLSQSGIQQAIAKLGIEQYRKWCEEGYKTVRYYDDVYSEWLAIPKSVKVTSVKPSGSVSLLAGATPGMHWPEATTYIRRMRLSKYSDLVQPLMDAGYLLEPAVGSEDSTLVVSIPVKIEEPLRTAAQVSMWEQLAMAAFLQRYWADNQVSATITFQPETEGSQLGHALNYYQYQLKGVSFLPRHDYGAYPQMPYEAIDEETYEAMRSRLAPLHFGKTSEAADQERFCSNDSCTI